MSDLVVKKSVLIIDTNLTDLTFLAKMLNEQYCVFTAHSAIEALSDVMRRQLPDIIICAANLPGMDGYELSRRIKAESNTQHIPFILMLAQSEVLVASKLSVSACDDFIFKPLDRLLIDYKVSYHLRKAKPSVPVQTDMIISKILIGSVSVLCDILRLQKPKIYAKSIRMAQYAVALLDLLELEHAGLLVSSVKLSLLGYLGIPEDIILKQSSGQSLSEGEQYVFSSHPLIASRMIDKIMYMDSIAKIISFQNNEIPSKFVNMPLETRPTVEIGAELIRLTYKYDTLVEQGVVKAEAIKQLLESPSLYDRQMVVALTNAEHGYGTHNHSVAINKAIPDLLEGDFIVQSVYTVDKVVVVEAGTILTGLNTQNISRHLDQIDITKSIWVERIN